MSQPIDTGALLSRSYALPAGPRVRLRMARRSDLPAIRDLLERRGLPAGDLGLSRLVRFDPQRRAVLCATAPLGRTETMVGVGAIDFAAPAEPDTIVVDERLTQGLGELLAGALVQRARARTRREA